MDILENRSPTLTTTHYGEPVVCYNSSGDGISGTLDANYYKGQGVVYGVEREYVVCIEGNGSRPSHQGDGFKESQTMYTLNTTEVHGVAYAYDARGNGGGCDSANDYRRPREQDNGLHGYCRRGEKMTYQKVTGTLSHGAHPGSYN